MFGYFNIIKDTKFIHEGQEQAKEYIDHRFKKYFEQRFQKWGVVRVEEWPEGLLVWVGGEIVYRSWKK